MDGQLTIGEQSHDAPHARREDPSTSHESAAAIEAVEGTTSVLRRGTDKHTALQAISERPSTGSEVERRTGIRGVWKRVSDLKNAGLITRSHEKVDSVTGRKAIVWQVTLKGYTALEGLMLQDEVRV